MAKVTASASKKSQASEEIGIGSISAVLDSPSPITEEHRHRMISEAAYYLAERREFEQGYQKEDWAEAEAEIDRILDTQNELGSPAE